MDMNITEVCGKESSQIASNKNEGGNIIKHSFDNLSLIVP